MKCLYFVSTLANKGVQYRVTDGDRDWTVIDPSPLPPGFVEYDEFAETKYVISIVQQHKAPPWVIETLKKFLQMYR